MRLGLGGLAPATTEYVCVGLFVLSLTFDWEDGCCLGVVDGFWMPSNALVSMESVFWISDMSGV